MDKEKQEAGHPSIINSTDKWEGVSLTDGQEQDPSKVLKHPDNPELHQWLLNPITMPTTNTINNMPNNFLSSNSSMPPHMLLGNSNRINHDSNINKCSDNDFLTWHSTQTDWWHNTCRLKPIMARHTPPSGCEYAHC